MKVQFRLQGEFHRLPLNGTDTTPVSLADLIQEVQAVATQNRRRSPELLRQSFGLDFLPKSVLINLLQQSQGVIRESELYQIPPLQILHPVTSNLKSQIANTYQYQFSCLEGTFNLTPDNPQIPLWTGGDLEQSGIYTIELRQPDYPGLSDEFAKNIWQYALQQWQALSGNHKINLALQSLDSNNFTLITNNKYYIKIWMSLQELSLDLREAISFLRLGESELSVLSESAKLLIQQYQLTDIPKKNPVNLAADQTLNSESDFLIRRGNSRTALQRIISQATQFLLLSSYVIEDESLTELICQKSQELPEGIWILTDLRDEVIEQIDIQSARVSSRLEYQRSHQRKKACLRMLLDANVRIRSGAFHLKTYISEQYAYLGSCNLTGGSLDSNLEAGLVSRNNTIHQQLINLFQQFWQQSSRDEVIPLCHQDGFKMRSLNRLLPEEYETYPSLLTPFQYHRDLLQQLRNFRGNVQIYSRSFQPSPEIEQYLRLLDTRIFIDSQVSASYSRITVERIHHLHAKITLLGEQVAYIGGINFSFNNHALALTDLMYKTTKSAEITQIRQKISLLHS